MFSVNYDHGHLARIVLFFTGMNTNSYTKTIASPLKIAFLVLAWGAGTGCGASTTMDAKASGVTPGGSQDAGYFHAKLDSGVVPQATDITIEGFLGEHDIQYPEASCDQVLCLHALIGNDRAVAEGGHATFVALAMATNVDLTTRARMPVNMAVVVDVSGSMAEAGKLDYVKQGLLTMIYSLNAEDRLSLVAYSSTARVVVESQPVADKQVFALAIEELRPTDSTNLYDGMVLGYEQVAAHLDAGSLARVMLLSDGLANTGTTDPEAIVAKSAEYNAQGIGITTVGVGLDFNQDLMRTLAEQGGGNFYYIEDPAKVTTVFDEELDFLVTPLANDLSITITLAPGFSVVDTFGIAYTEDEAGALTLSVPTVFASSHGGAMLIRVDSTDSITGREGEVVTQVSYSYRPIADDGSVLDSTSAITDARLPALDDELDEAAASVGVAKAIVLWNMVASFQKASELYWARSYNDGAALEQIEALGAYVDLANAKLNDEEIAKDKVELINQFAMNLGGYLGDTTYEGHCKEGTSPDGTCADGIYYDDAHEGPMLIACAAAPGDKLPVLLCVVVLGLARCVRRLRLRA
jgi:Ca-activated chloride channel homolog